MLDRAYKISSWKFKILIGKWGISTKIQRKKKLSDVNNLTLHPFQLFKTMFWCILCEIIRGTFGVDVFDKLLNIWSINRNYLMLLNFHSIFVRFRKIWRFFLQLEYPTGYGIALVNYVVLVIFCNLGENLERSVNCNLLFIEISIEIKMKFFFIVDMSRMCVLLKDFTTCNGTCYQWNIKRMWNVYFIGFRMRAS